MKLPIIQPPSPDAPSVAVSTAPVNLEVTARVVGLIEDMAPGGVDGWVALGEILERLGRRKHKAGVSRPTLLWSLWHLWNSGTIVFSEADSSSQNIADLPKGKSAEITQGAKGGRFEVHGNIRNVRLGYARIARHGATNLATASRGDRYRYGPTIDKPPKSGLSLPEKDWVDPPVEWIAKGAPLTVAYGGGVDSTAVLVEFVRRRYPVELVLFADVGNEKPETYQYLKIMDQYLRDNGYPGITVVRYEMTPQGIARRQERAATARGLLGRGVTFWPKGAGSSNEGEKQKEIRPIDPRGYTSLGQNCVYNLTYPSLAFGFQDHNCSAKWKVKPQVDFIASSREFGPRAQEAWNKGLPVIRTIGFDAGPGDRGRRNRIPDDIHHLHWYPLQDWGWDRDKAIQEIRKAGLPVPLKSSCVFCPSTQPEEVEWLVREHPEIIDEIRLIEDTARPYNEGGPQQGLWYMGSKMPREDQQRFGHEYWFGGGTTPATELARFVQLHYLGTPGAAPTDAQEQVETARRIISRTVPHLSVTQLDRKKGGERIRGWLRVADSTGKSLSPDQIRGLGDLGLEVVIPSGITLSPEELELYVSVWLQGPELRALGAPGAPTPGRISDFVQGYLYLCDHHPDHPRCMGWRPGHKATPQQIAWTAGGQLYARNPTSSAGVDPSEVYPSVRNELDDAIARAMSAGAVPPLHYAGAGAYGIVLCDVTGRAFKVARHWPRLPHAAESLRQEAAWLAFAAQVPQIRRHVASVYGFDEDSAVLVRECVQQREHRSINEKRLWELHGRIGAVMKRYGFRAPEYKPDSFVYDPRRGPVLVDAGLGSRDLGWSGARRAQELAQGAPPIDEHEVSSVIHGLRMDAGTELPAETANRLADRLERLGMRRNPARRRCWSPGSFYETMCVGKRSEAAVIRSCVSDPHGRLIHAGYVQIPRKPGLHRTALGAISGVPARADRGAVRVARRELLAGEHTAPVRIGVTAEGHVVVDQGAHLLAAARSIGARWVMVDWSFGKNLTLGEQALAAIAALIAFTPIEEIAAASLIGALA